MTAFKKYIGYRLKSSFLQTVSFALIALVITVFTAFESVDLFSFSNRGRTGIESLATIMGIIASIIPMLETAHFKNRRNLDTLYFLPISRFKMALAHYVSGLLQVIAIYTVAFIGHTAVLLQYAGHFRLEYLPVYYVLLLLLGVIIYSVFIFVFGEANSTADGVICAAMWIFALYLAACACEIPVKQVALEIYHGYSGNYYLFLRELEQFTTGFIPYAMIDKCTMVFQSIMEGWGDYNGAEIYMPTVAEAVAMKFKYWYMSFFWLAAGAASAWGYFRTFMRKGAEKAGEVSSSWFCYKLLIPVYGFSLMTLTQNEIILCLLVAAAMYLSYAVYRKSFKITCCDIITLTGVSVAGLLWINL